MGRLVLERTMEAEEKADAEARRLISTTMERLASDLTSESTVKAIALPSDDMKGRVIGARAATSGPSRLLPASTSSSTTRRRRWSSRASTP